MLLQVSYESSMSDNKENAIDEGAMISNIKTHLMKKLRHFSSRLSPSDSKKNDTISNNTQQIEVKITVVSEIPLAK